MNAAPLRRLSELEGLRGLLSWWVVVCHALTHAGYSEATLGRGLRILVHGDYPVEVFIVLSGFVIHKLWHDAREPYGIFIARRFLRLWPAYMACLLGALALRPCLSVVFSHAPLGDPQLLATRLVNWQHEESHLAAQVVAHLPMLHSAVPETLLPTAAVAILGPAWSISLEWQFYLIAPLLFAALERGRGRAWLAFAAVAGLGWTVRYVPPWSVWFPMQAFLPQKLLLFGLGMISHQLWPALHDRASAAAPALFGLSGLILFTTLSIPLALWTFTLAAVLASDGCFKALLNSRPMQLIGRVSYSTYLGHMLIVWPLQAAMLSFKTDITQPQMLAVLLIVGAPLTLLFSMALHRWVEKPAIAYGRQLGSR
jgi:peptidoglycan/LPS O-acetylase OafA/YrhL